MEKAYRRDKSGWRQAVIWNLTLLAAALGYMAFTVATKIYCPIRHFTGIPCPGCGMSRALGCLLRLDFRGSLRCNPALLPCVTAVFFLVNRETAVLAKVNRRVVDIVIGGGFGLMAVTYLVRLLFFEIP